MLLGFSTGCLYKTHERVSKETFSSLRAIGCNALEVSCSDEQELEKMLTEIEVSDLVGFEYVSLHAPIITSLKTLELLEKVQHKFNFKKIVIHPDEIENWEVLKKFNLPLAIENMDWRKEFGKYVDSMQAIFEKIDAPMVLDLNHCYTNDPSMLLAKEMADIFGGRIEEIHISGFEQFHEPLFKTQQVEILQAIPDKRLPIIIESGCETIEEAKMEFEYVKNFLEK